LKNFLFGKPEESEGEKFRSIYDDLKVKMDGKIKESNKRAREQLLNSGKKIEQ